MPELNKPERVTCQHLDKNCTIYDSRPASCAKFECAWLQGKLPEEMRPDKVGVMIEDHEKFIFVMSDGEEWVKLKDTFAKYTFRGIPVVVGTKQGSNGILPPGMKPETVVEMIKEKLK